MDHSIFSFPPYVEDLFYYYYFYFFGILIFFLTNKLSFISKPYFTFSHCTPARRSPPFLLGEFRRTLHSQLPQSQPSDEIAAAPSLSHSLASASKQTYFSLYLSFSQKHSGSAPNLRRWWISLPPLIFQIHKVFFLLYFFRWLWWVIQTFLLC